MSFSDTLDRFRLSTATVVRGVGAKPLLLIRAVRRGTRRSRARISELYSRIPRWFRHGVGILLVALVGLLLGVQLGGNGDYKVGPLQVQMELKPALHGESRVEIPPLGSLSVDSHDSPTMISARIQQFDERDTRALVEDPSRLKAASQDAPDEIVAAVTDLALRAAIGVTIVTLLLGLIVFRRFWRTVIAGALALTLLAGVVGLTWATWRPESIREPRYEGLLTRVPAVVGDARSISDDFDAYRDELAQFITNMSGVYTTISNLQSFKTDPNSIRVLHISDLHLNPASWDVISSISRQFDVNVIVDTGDITDWGSKLENSYADNIGKLDAPYVFIRGNHDSQVTADAVAGQPNATVLENEVREVGGLTFAGIGDGRLNSDKSQGALEDNLDVVTAQNRKLAETIERYNGAGRSPDSTEGDEPAEPDAVEGSVDEPVSGSVDSSVDIVLTHDPAGADEFADSAPLVLAGHKHKRSQRALDDDTLLRVEGSTGASGLRGLYNDGSDTSLRMSLLYFSPEGKLLAYDEITASGASQSKLTLERKLVDDTTETD